jgi:hypothetical protein
LGCPYDAWQPIDFLSKTVTKANIVSYHCSE